jgi:3-phosphoshikimate 1-carboxyvinyltransferase
LIANKLVSSPVESINGIFTVPGDKSISHRAVLFGCIAQGITRISGFLDGADCMATLGAFQSMSVRIEGPIDQNLIIHGVGKHGLKKPKGIIDCGNSGTSIRLLAGLMAAQPFDSQLTGDASLLNRPMLRVSKPLMKMGANILTTDGKPPIFIQKTDHLRGIHYLMEQASAQVKTCILLAGLYARGQTSICETSKTRDHTERMLKAFSYPLLQEGNTLTIDSKHECQGTEITIPGDISSAAFFIVAATIIPGSDVLISNVGINPTRTGIIDILSAMGASISILNPRSFGEEPVADLHVKYSPLKGIEIPKSLVPLAIDEFPILFIAAACAQGQTILHGAKELRFKESDRIGVMVDGLVELGIDASGLEDGIRIQGGGLHGGVVNSQGDHRIAMAFAVAGAASIEPVTILNSAQVATSFPTFVHTANKVHFHIEEMQS